MKNNRYLLTDAKAIIALIMQLSLLPFVIIPTPMLANPSGGSVVNGQVSFSSSGSTLTINQASDKAIINWNDFSIAQGELTQFIQPSSSSAALNRVTSGNSSQIMGTLKANGKIFLINPNGILIGSTGKIDVGSFLASTLNVSNDEFLAGGDMIFSGDSTAVVRNLGSIDANGGDVFLIARQVINEGSTQHPMV